MLADSVVDGCGEFNWRFLEIESTSLLGEEITIVGTGLEAAIPEVVALPLGVAKPNALIPEVGVLGALCVANLEVGIPEQVALDVANLYREMPEVVALGVTNFEVERGAIRTGVLNISLVRRGSMGQVSDKESIPLQVEGLIILGTCTLDAIRMSLCKGDFSISSVRRGCRSQTNLGVAWHVMRSLVRRGSVKHRLSGL